MTKRQANNLIALALTAILTQIFCTAVVLRGLDRIRNEAAAQVNAMDVLEMQNQTIRKVSPPVTMRVPNGFVVHHFRWPTSPDIFVSGSSTQTHGTRSHDH